MIATLGAGLINRASKNSNGAQSVLSLMIRVPPCPCPGRPQASNARITLAGRLRCPLKTQRKRSALLVSMPAPGLSFRVLSMDFPGWFHEKVSETVWSAPWPCSDEASIMMDAQSPALSPSLFPSPTSSPLPTTAPAPSSGSDEPEPLRALCGLLAPWPCSSSTQTWWRYYVASPS